MVAITKPSSHFNVVTDTGANIKTTAQNLYSGSDYLMWIKDRANANNHQLIDTVRGLTAVLQSNSTGAETTYSAPAGSSVAWVWKAGSSAVSNTGGSITSTVSANQTAGFSIVTYTGTGANATVGHGLGKAPAMVIVKDRTAANTNGWMVWHSGIANTEVLFLHATNAKTSDVTSWNSASPTSSVFSIGTNANLNTNAHTHVAYCFAEIAGFSKFGSYVGNGSADGTFVYCGFRPRYVLIKRTDTGGGYQDWLVVDTIRDTYNAEKFEYILRPNYLGAEGYQSNAALASGPALDILSNGFKLRDPTSYINTSGGTYIFAAFAEFPFGGSNVAPAPAR